MRVANVVLAFSLGIIALPESGLAAGLAGSEWKPVEVTGEAVDPNTRAFVQFGSEGRVAGNAGCNRFTGTYSVDEEAIAIEPGAITRMACDPETDRFERLFVETLAQSESWHRNRTDLELRGRGDVILLRFRQTDPD